MRARSAVLALVALTAVAFAAVARAAVIGIDAGGEFLKVSLVAPGRVPIGIAVNEISKRKTTAAVSFYNAERQVGESAMDFMPRSPEIVVTRARDALGVSSTSKRFEKIKEDSKLAYKTVHGDATRKDTIVIDAKNAGKYSAEELFAMTLEYAMKVGEDQGRGKIRDAVIAVPPFASQAQRRGILDAAKVAGLNVLALKSDLSCAALQWGIDKEFAEDGTPTWVVLVDVGSTSSSAALVRYSSWAGKEGGKKKYHGQFEIVDVKWDETVGGDTLDMLLVDRFVKEFEEKHSADLSKTPRSVGKMRKNVRKTKEILSANKEAPFSVESLHDDIDLRSTIDRAAFTDIAKDVFERMTQPLRDVVAGLERFNVTLADIEAIEVIGGSTRVPGVKDAIMDALGGRKFDVHLDADEAVAMGAGLFAANMSTTFRMRKFGALDAMPHGMTYTITPSDDFTSSEPTTLVEPFARTPLAHRVSLYNRTSDAKIVVALDRADGSPLPPGTETDQVMIIDITNVKDAMAKHNDTVGKMNVYFDFDVHGILDVTRAEYVVEVIEYVPEKPKKKKANNSTNATTVGANATDVETNATTTTTTPDETNVTDAEETPAEVVVDEVEVEEPPKMKARRRVHRTLLDVKISGLPMEPLTETQIESSIRVLGDLRKKDDAKRAQEAAKSNLEAYIYSMRAKLDDESIQEVTDEEQRTTLKDLLMDKEDWLYMDGADASTEEFKKTHNELQTQGDAMEFRAAELTRRPETIKKARAFIEKAKVEIETWAEKKPWLNATHTTELLEGIIQFESWLDEKEEAQNKLSKTETPSLESTEIKITQRPLEAKFKKLKNKPKPKPPKVETNTTDTNATDANATDANATTVGGEEDRAAGAGEATDGEGVVEEDAENIAEDVDAATNDDVKDEL